MIYIAFTDCCTSNTTRPVLAAAGDTFSCRSPGSLDLLPSLFFTGYTHHHPDAASGASLQLMDRLNLEPLATTARGIKLLHLLAEQ